jgi:hypothetical protein
MIVEFSGKRLNSDGLRFVLTSDDINCEQTLNGITASWRPPSELTSSIDMLARYLLQCKVEIREHGLVDNCTIVIHAIAWSVQQEIIIDESLASVLHECGASIIIRPFT